MAKLPSLVHFEPYFHRSIFGQGEGALEKRGEDCPIIEIGRSLFFDLDCLQRLGSREEGGNGKNSLRFAARLCAEPFESFFHLGDTAPGWLFLNRGLFFLRSRLRCYWLGLFIRLRSGGSRCAPL